MTGSSGSYAAHSKYGASSATRFINCPGSVRMSAAVEALYGPFEDSEFAAEGTAAHELATVCLEDGSDAWEHTGEEIVVKGQTFEVDVDMTVAVQVYLDKIRDDIAKYKREFGNDYWILIEKSFHHPEIHEHFYGTSDCSVFFPGWSLLKVYDYKHGIGIAVSARDNDQLQYYALGVLHLPELSDIDVGAVDLTIVQPRAHHEEGPVRSWKTWPDQLGEWLNLRLLPAIEKAEKPGAELVPGDWCRFCTVKQAGVCPALNELATNAEEVKPFPVTKFTDAELADRMKQAAVLKMWTKEVEKEGFNRLMEGKAVPGFKLVPKKAERVFKEYVEEGGKPYSVVEALEKFYGDELYEKKLKSPAQVEKMKGGAELVKMYAYKPETGLTVAPESDTRGAVPRRTAQDAFAGINHIEPN